MQQPCRARADGHLLKGAILTFEWAPAFAGVTFVGNCDDCIDC